MLVYKLILSKYVTRTRFLGRLVSAIGKQILQALHRTPSFLITLITRQWKSVSVIDCIDFMSEIYASGSANL